jgi:hypothetical protein
VDHADNFVDRASIHGHAAVAGLGDDAGHLARVRGLVDGEDRGTGGHHLRDRLLPEPYDAGDDLRLGMLADSLEFALTQQILDFLLAGFLLDGAARPGKWPGQGVRCPYEGPQHHRYSAQHRHEHGQQT